MKNNMKLQRKNFKLGIITSSLAFILSSGITFGYPASDSYYFVGEDVKSVEINNNKYIVNFDDGNTESITKDELNHNDKIGYNGWTNIELSGGRETPISVKPFNTKEIIARVGGCIGMFASGYKLVENTKNYLKTKTLKK